MILTSDSSLLTIPVLSNTNNVVVLYWPWHSSYPIDELQDDTFTIYRPFSSIIQIDPDQIHPISFILPDVSLASESVRCVINYQTEIIGSDLSFNVFSFDQLHVANVRKTTSITLIGADPSNQQFDWNAIDLCGDVFSLPSSSIAGDGLLSIDNKINLSHPVKTLPKKGPFIQRSSDRGCFLAYPSDAEENGFYYCLNAFSKNQTTQETIEDGFIFSVSNLSDRYTFFVVADGQDLFREETRILPVLSGQSISLVYSVKTYSDYDVSRTFGVWNVLGRGIKHDKYIPFGVNKLTVNASLTIPVSDMDKEFIWIISDSDENEVFSVVFPKGQPPSPYYILNESLSRIEIYLDGDQDPSMKIDPGNSAGIMYATDPESSQGNILVLDPSLFIGVVSLSVGRSLSSQNIAVSPRYVMTENDMGHAFISVTENISDPTQAVPLTLDFPIGEDNQNYLIENKTGEPLSVRCNGVLLDPIPVPKSSGGQSIGTYQYSKTSMVSYRPATIEGTPKFALTPDNLKQNLLEVQGDDISNVTITFPVDQSFGKTSNYIIFNGFDVSSVTVSLGNNPSVQTISAGNSAYFEYDGNTLKSKPPFVIAFSSGDSYTISDSLMKKEFWFHVTGYVGTGSSLKLIFPATNSSGSYYPQSLYFVSCDVGPGSVSALYGSNTSGVSISSNVPPVVLLYSSNPTLPANGLVLLTDVQDITTISKRASLVFNETLGPASLIKTSPSSTNIIFSPNIIINSTFQIINQSSSTQTMLVEGFDYPSPITIDPFSVSDFSFMGKKTIPFIKNSPYVVPKSTLLIPATPVTSSFLVTNPFICINDQSLGQGANTDFLLELPKDFPNGFYAIYNNQATGIVTVRIKDTVTTPSFFNVPVGVSAYWFTLASTGPGTATMNFSQTYYGLQSFAPDFKNWQVTIGYSQASYIQSFIVTFDQEPPAGESIGIYLQDYNVNENIFWSNPNGYKLNFYYGIPGKDRHTVMENAQGITAVAFMMQIVQSSGDRNGTKVFLGPTPIPGQTQDYVVIPQSALSSSHLLQCNTNSGSNLYIEKLQTGAIQRFTIDNQKSTSVILSMLGSSVAPITCAGLTRTCINYTSDNIKVISPVSLINSLYIDPSLVLNPRKNSYVQASESVYFLSYPRADIAAGICIKANATDIDIFYGGTQIGKILNSEQGIFHYNGSEVNKAIGSPVLTGTSLTMKPEQLVNNLIDIEAKTGFQLTSVTLNFPIPNTDFSGETYDIENKGSDLLIINTINNASGLTTSVGSLVRGESKNFSYSSNGSTFGTASPVVVSYPDTVYQITSDELSANNIFAVEGDYEKGITVLLPSVPKDSIPLSCALINQTPNTVLVGSDGSSSANIPLLSGESGVFKVTVKSDSDQYIEKEALYPLSVDLSNSYYLSESEMQYRVLNFTGDIDSGFSVIFSGGVVLDEQDGQEDETWKYSLQNNATKDITLYWSDPTKNPRTNQYPITLPKNSKMYVAYNNSNTDGLPYVDESTPYFVLVKEETVDLSNTFLQYQYVDIIEASQDFVVNLPEISIAVSPAYYLIYNRTGWTATIMNQNGVSIGTIGSQTCQCLTITANVPSLSTTTGFGSIVITSIETKLTIDQIGPLPIVQVTKTSLLFRDFSIVLTNDPDTTMSGQYTFWNNTRNKMTIYLGDSSTKSLAVVASKEAYTFEYIKDPLQTTTIPPLLPPLLCFTNSPRTGFSHVPPTNDGLFKGGLMISTTNEDGVESNSATFVARAQPSSQHEILTQILVPNSQENTMKPSYGFFSISTILGKTVLRDTQSGIGLDNKTLNFFLKYEDEPYTIFSSTLEPDSELFETEFKGNLNIDGSITISKGLGILSGGTGDTDAGKALKNLMRDKQYPTGPGSFIMWNKTFDSDSLLTGEWIPSSAIPTVTSNGSKPFWNAEKKTYSFSDDLSANNQGGNLLIWSQDLSTWTKSQSFQTPKTANDGDDVHELTPQTLAWTYQGLHSEHSPISVRKRGPIGWNTVMVVGQTVGDPQYFRYTNKTGDLSTSKIQDDIITWGTPDPK